MLFRVNIGVYPERLRSLWGPASVAYIWKRNVYFSLRPWTGQRIHGWGW